MKKGSVEERVLNILCDQLMVDFDETQKALKKKDLNIVKDLGADEMDIIELVCDFENEFNIEIENDEYDSVEDTEPRDGKAFRNFSQIVQLIERKLKKLQKLKS